MKMDVLAKLEILTDAAKYDAACTSSGVRRGFRQGYIGNTTSAIAGCCHTFSADGRCVTLLKVLMSNCCVYDCAYCVNRRSNDTRRAAAPELVEQLGLLADRLSCNIELPSEAGLRTLAPEKTKAAVLAPMRQIQVRSIQNKEELVKYRHTPKFAPAGQSTQMIVGATPDSDLHILRLTQGLYDRYQLKRVFFSAYVPVVESALLPSKETKPPLLREHRLYQADWLLRFYGFRAEELLDEQTPSFDPRLDPKCCWALRHPDFFPVEVNRADYEALLRVPGLGVVSARRILTARRSGPLRLENLPKLGVVMKRAQYFLTANGRMADGLRFTQDSLLRNLIAVEQSLLPQPEMRQLSLFDDAV